MTEQKMDVIIGCLCSAYKEWIAYMKSANETFMNYISKEPDMQQRWEDFYEREKNINHTTLSELRGMVERLQENQIIEAEVAIR